MSIIEQFVGSKIKGSIRSYRTPGIPFSSHNLVNISADCQHKVQINKEKKRHKEAYLQQPFAGNELRWIEKGRKGMEGTFDSCWVEF